MGVSLIDKFILEEWLYTSIKLLFNLSIDYSSVDLSKFK